MRGITCVSHLPALRCWLIGVALFSAFFVANAALAAATSPASAANPNSTTLSGCQRLSIDNIDVFVTNKAPYLDTVAAIIDVPAAGYYRVFAEVFYNSGDRQKNESYYIEIRNADGRISRPHDPNAGDYRVVPDVATNQDLNLRDSGLFYFSAGRNEIILNHYAKIADEYPQFLNGDFAEVESLHLYAFILTRQDYDLALSQRLHADSTIVLADSTRAPAVLAGSAYSAELTLKNLGPATAPACTLTFTQPPHTDFGNSSLPPTWRAANASVWTFDSLAAGDSVHITIDLRVAPSLPLSPWAMQSTAKVALYCDANSKNNSTTAVAYGLLPVRDIDVTVTLSAGADTAFAGEALTYQIEAHNAGTDSAANAGLLHLLPPGLSFEHAQPAPAINHGDTLRWPLGTLAPGEKRRFEVHVSIPATTPPGLHRLQSKAIIRADFEPIDRLGDNVATATVINPVPAGENAIDVLVTLAADRDTVAEGGTFVYAITAANAGRALAQQVRLALHLPDSLRAGAALPTPSLLTPDSLVWELGSLRPGERRSFEIGMRVAGKMPAGVTALRGQAIIHAPGEDATALANNRASTTVWAHGSLTPPVAVIDVAVTQRLLTPSTQVLDGDTLQVVGEGESYECVITVANAGDTTAPNVTAVALVPQKLAISHHQPPPAHSDSDTIRWQLGDLAVGEQIELRYRATLPAAMPVGTNRLVHHILVAAAGEDSTRLGNNAATSTAFNIVQPQAGVPPLIEAIPGQVEVGDSIFVRVLAHSETSIWDIWVYHADGEIDSSFGDRFITGTTLPAGVWIDLPEAYTDTRLTTDAERELLIFELHTIDRFGNHGSARAQVQVQSANKLVLERNVFKAGFESDIAINFKLSSNRAARIDLYDFTGSHLTRITEAVYQAGWNTYRWNGITESGLKVGSGLYLVTLRSGAFTDFKKVIVVR